jgi:hypothetical protein
MNFPYDFCNSNNEGQVFLDGQSVESQSLEKVQLMFKRPA